MYIYQRIDNKLVSFDTRRAIISALYSPCYEYWSFYSPIILGLIEKYKDVPLTKYEPSKYMAKMLKDNPSKAETIPRWEVKGYDQLVGDQRIENRLRDEFYRMYQQDDISVVDFVNEYNPEYRVTL